MLPDLELGCKILAEAGLKGCSSADRGSAMAPAAKKARAEVSTRGPKFVRSAVVKITEATRPRL